MKDKLEQFFKTDFYYVKVGLDREDDPIRRNEICWYARQRALGASDLAQLCGLDYETAQMMFGEYCHKLEVAEYEML